MKDFRIFLIAFVFSLFNCLTTYIQAQETNSDKPKKIGIGVSALFSGSEYMQNYNPSGSLGFGLIYYPTKTKRLSFESGLYFSFRTLFVNKNYSNLPCDQPELCDPLNYKLHSLTFFYTEIPFFINYTLYKSPKEINYFVSGGILTSYRFGVHSKFTRELATSQKFSPIQINSNSVYSGGVISPVPNYDVSLMFGMGLNFKEKYFISLLAQKGFIKLERFIKEEQGGSFNVLSLKIAYSF